MSTPSSRDATLPRVDVFLDQVRALSAQSLRTVLARYAMLETRGDDPGILALMDVAARCGRTREIDEVVDAAYTVALDLSRRLEVELVPILDVLVSATVALALAGELAEVQAALYEPFATEIPPDLLTTPTSEYSVRFAGAA